MMDIVVGLLVVFFMLFIDYRLNKIYKELRGLNQFCTAYWKLKTGAPPGGR